MVISTAISAWQTRSDYLNVFRVRPSHIVTGEFFFQF